MDFGQWEFILSNGTQADQDLVWNAIKGKPVQLKRYGHQGDGDGV